MTSPAAAPVLEAEDLRIDVGGTPAIDGLALNIRSRRTLVLGAARALFEAAAGLRPSARGVLRVLGMNAHAALGAGRSAGAPLDPPLPPRFDVGTYLAWSARLAGETAKVARATASDVARRLALEPVLGQDLAALSPPVRRAVIVAGALASRPEVVFLEDPVAGLADGVARGFARALDDALSGVSFVAFAGSAPSSGALAQIADEVVVLSGSTVVSRGTPHEIAARAGMYTLRVGGDVGAFVEAAQQRGVRIAGDGSRLTACLVDGVRVVDLLALAEESRAVVLELRPVALPLA